jgi:hypothetical protein
MRYLSNSQIQCFKKCRRRYWFEYVEKLEPITRDKNLQIGSSYHEGVAGGEVTDPLSKIMVDHFFKHIHLTPDAVEQKFEVRIPGMRGIRLVGTVDGIVGNSLIEHKTASSVSPSYLHHLLWDEQASTYIYATGLGQIQYYIIEKCKLRLKQNETEEQLLDRIEAWYNESCRITEHTVYRTSAQIQNFLKNLRATISDIRTCKNFYPNPNQCSIMSCPYAGMCLEDTPEIRVNFKSKEERYHVENDEAF